MRNNHIWLYPREGITLDAPPIPPGATDRDLSNELTIIGKTSSYNHRGHPRQEFDCYLKIRFGHYKDGNTLSTHQRKCLQDVINVFPNAEYTINSGEYILHFDEEDSVALILQLGI